jgi:hypothetical protein
MHAYTACCCELDLCYTGINRALQLICGSLSLIADSTSGVVASVLSNQDLFLSPLDDANRRTAVGAQFASHLP